MNMKLEPDVEPNDVSATRVSLCHMTCLGIPTYSGISRFLVSRIYNTMDTIPQLSQFRVTAISRPSMLDLPHVLVSTFLHCESRWNC